MEFIIWIGRKRGAHGSNKGWGGAVFYGNANRKRNWLYMSLSPLHLGGLP